MKLVFENDYIKVFHGSYNELISLEYKFDAIITDPPYGMTNNLWDKRINFEEIWNLFNLVKINSYTPIIMFGDFPFSIDLINSKRNWYRYTWYWNKLIGTGFLDSAYKPLKVVEHIHVFAEKTFQLIKSKEDYKKFDKIAKFYPQMTIGKPNHSMGRPDKTITNNNYNAFDPFAKIKKVSNMQTEFYRKGLRRIEKKTAFKHPKNYIEIQRVKPNKYIKLHPTEKPVLLMEYLIKTYTKENDLILDCFAGSGATAIACMNLKRKCILVEKEEKYIELIIKRIEQREK